MKKLLLITLAATTVQLQAPPLPLVQNQPIQFTSQNQRRATTPALPSTPGAAPAAPTTPPAVQAPSGPVVSPAAPATPALTPAQEKRLKEINSRLETIDRILNWKYSGKPVLNTGAKTPGERGTIKYDQMYFDNPTCSTYGSNPDTNKDAQGNLTTPCYVITSEEQGNIYIYYTYLYGFNAPYDVGPFSGDTFEFQDAHEADYEHVTLELDKNTKALKRIFFAAHGTTEGFWLPVNHPDILWEGTHPVSFSARGSHADYPREGTWIRIFGIANDVTNKGTRWTPKLCRIFTPDDKRFDPKTMGWVVFPGTMGRRGVGVPVEQSWFLNNAGGNIGHDYNSAPFCHNPPTSGRNAFEAFFEDTGEEIKYEACIASKVAQATPPSAAGW